MTEDMSTTRQCGRLVVFTKNVGANEASFRWAKLGVDEVLHGSQLLRRKCELSRRTYCYDLEGAYADEHAGE
jgi:hypothetical protein